MTSSGWCLSLSMKSALCRRPEQPARHGAPIARRWRPPCLHPQAVGAPSVENRGIVFPIPPAGGKDAKGYPIGNDVTSDVAVRRHQLRHRPQAAGRSAAGRACHPRLQRGRRRLPLLNKATAFRDGDVVHANALLDEAAGRWQ